ncbi:hypothetical protein [Actinomadura sp. 21ATH]|uniref:hypothetical protein n=1 Tax=Actinomadura sp. 21ATH TaxID=1735444 RepID=UPI0035C0D02A
MLNRAEAALVAVLLEELVGHPAADVRAAAEQMALMLNWRLASSEGTGPDRWPDGDSGPVERRDAGVARDEAALKRDLAAQRRDTRAQDRDLRARARDAAAADADQDAADEERLLAELLRAAELRDRVAAEHAAHTRGRRLEAGRPESAAEAELRQQAEVDREMAAADREHNLQDRKLLRTLLAAAAQRRQEAVEDRCDSDQDRRQAAQDRVTAAADRREALHDRWQAYQDRERADADSRHSSTGSELTEPW